MQHISTPLSEATRIEVNVSEFARGEIAVKLRRDNTLLVHALHLDQFAPDNFFRKELVKTFPIPAGADVDRIRSIIRNNGILTIDIPMIRDNDATRRSHEELLKSIENPKFHGKNDYSRSASHVDVTRQEMFRTRPSNVPKRAESLIDMERRQYLSPCFNIAEFLQSKFHPTFSSNGKKIQLKINTQGYEPDELTVRLLDDNLIVQGRKKSSSIKNTEEKQFSENVRLPEGIDRYNVTSQVTDDGILFIEVPLLNPKPFDS